MTEFKVSQKIEQDIKGEYLILLDTSNYSDNSSGLTRDDFVSREWRLKDVYGVVTVVSSSYSLTGEDSAKIEIDKDKYLEITLNITADILYSVTNVTGLVRRAQYRKYTLISRTLDKCACHPKLYSTINTASELIEAAIIDAKTYNPNAFTEKIEAANVLLFSEL